MGTDAAQAAATAALHARWPESLVVSARDPAGVAAVRAAIIAFFSRDLVEAELRIPYDRQSLRGDIFSACQVL